MWQRYYKCEKVTDIKYLTGTETIIVLKHGFHLTDKFLFLGRAVINTEKIVGVLPSELLITASCRPFLPFVCQPFLDGLGGEML